MKRVLIVDDAAFMRLTLKTILEKHGFEVVGEGEDGATGIVKYKELKPDIVTMDITMPEISGIEALRAIMEMDPGAKVVMVSAMGQKPLVTEAIESGAKGFIVKPFKEERVINTLNGILGL